MTNGHAGSRMNMRRSNALNSAMPCDPWAWAVGPTARSGAGGHVGGQEIDRVAVEVFAGPVVAHRGAWIGVPGSDLDIPQVHARIKHGRDESMAEHVRVRPGDLYTRSVGQAPQAAGGGVAVHPGTPGVEQDRPAG